ncbi:MAG: dUTP diphosphatase [Pseudomonadota bacterium]
MTGKIKLEIVQLDHAKDLPLPAYETDGAAGMDLRAAIPDGEPLTLESGAYKPIPTGIAIALPAGFEAQIRPRSGLAARHGITLLNSPGTVDSDYRGEIQAILINHSLQDFVIERGMRIAQMVIAPYTAALIVPVSQLTTTVRGSGGFGSTGFT